MTSAAIAPEVRPVLDLFFQENTVESCEKYGHGHINRTYLVVTTEQKRYILQKINTRVFRNAHDLMENIAVVSEYLSERTDDPRAVLHLVPTLDGQSFVDSKELGVWRVFDYLDNSICLQLPECSEDFYQSAVAFGHFQEMLKDFPARKLHETIPHFHDTPDRYRQFKEVVAADPMGRAKDVQEEIQFVLDHEEEAHVLVDLLAKGKLPLRVTHNDTKLNNVMLDATTRKALCVIDLDTVMPGLSLYDFGDSIRFGASTAAEDEQDLRKVELDLAMYETYTEGFLKSCPGLTDMEREMLPMGAKMMTLEMVVRFLADHIDGDNYFAIQRPGQNLDRARTQMKLVQDMEKKWDAMIDIVHKLSEK